MKKMIEALVAELKDAGKEKYVYTNGRSSDPEAKVNVWYVVSKIEEALLYGSKGSAMAVKLQGAIAALRKDATKFASSDLDPEAKVNVWYVIAQLNEALLEDK